MLVFSADVYAKSLDSVYFHIPLHVYSGGYKCNTYPLFTSAFTQSVCFSCKHQAALVFAAFTVNDDRSALLTLMKSQRLLG